MAQNENSQQQTKTVQKRKWWFRFMKKLMRGRYKQPRFVYLGEQFTTGGVILSNHEGTDAPMSLEIYCDKPIRMWGAHEMNSGLIKMYKYQTRVYYHEKKHWNLHLARLFCLIASPLTNLFYKGLNLISTYRDGRFLSTLRESVKAIEAGDNIVIFPEVSDNGYQAELEGFHAGFYMLAEACAKKGIDVPVYVTYFQKEKKVYVVDKPVYWSQLKGEGLSREETVNKLLLRCNELGKMQFDEQSTEENVERSASAV
ncbi:MAG: hypothetical protein IJD33_05400 [Clostridia bacterium]|nr:hypothetical protein [Clostridia bacterium]